MLPIERDAVITNGKLHCPYCGSADVVYSEDLTNRHKVITITNGVIVLDVDGECDDLTSNERIYCEECGTSSGLPEGYDLEFVDGLIDEEPQE